MTMKMNRRTFLKTTAATALAVSLSGVLTACGGGSTPPKPNWHSRWPMTT